MALTEQLDILCVSLSVYSIYWIVQIYVTSHMHNTVMQYLLHQQTKRSRIFLLKLL